MGTELVALHWVYLIFIFLILGVMVMRRDTTLVCIVGIFVIGLIVKGSITSSIIGIFNSLIYAITELVGTILVISIIVAMSKVLAETGINETMISPFTKLMKNPSLAYWTVGLLMMIISWFFWPSPAVALIGVVLLPAAVKAGLPALGVAMVMNLFGHGIALSSDFIIQGAPKLTADGAGIPVGSVISASVPLIVVMGIVTTVTAFYILKRDMKKGILKVEGNAKDYKEQNNKKGEMSIILKRVFAVVVPILFLLDVVAMYTNDLRGGDATALIGGTAAFILIVLSMVKDKKSGLENITAYLVEGLQFGFRVFGPVIPIAAFFYLGDSGLIKVFGEVLPSGSHGIVNDLGLALANTVPLNSAIGAITTAGVGAITGLDGSGFSGISLAGSVAKLFGTAIGRGTATLTALGQVAAIWVGGGTLIPWAVIPVAAICDVDPFELVRRNIIPVVIGMVATIIAAIIII
ncbi:membrane protein [Fervidicella metallireducens AeB]|uniref:Membrane protein n=1 Tax=Fervidicella metallireducens AeB TaxID=1403537 RepID=A0A017RSH1_9CLOT|nr:membrane protein [Fervidicella metallireducens]EYE87562.1 membrane protein [Fervidicella metallireducens AeB]